jgi:hypothetical protein
VSALVIGYLLGSGADTQVCPYDLEHRKKNFNSLPVFKLDLRVREWDRVWQVVGLNHSDALASGEHRVGSSQSSQQGDFPVPAKQK